MQFTSLSFAYFFVITGTIAWSLSRWRTAQKGFLLLASFFFYARFTWHLPLLLATSTLIAYVGGELMWRLPPSQKRKVVQWVSVSLQVALLGVFKLNDFFRENFVEIAAWLGLTSHITLLDLALPAGISFYVFQAIAYLIDVGRTGQPGRTPAVRPKTWLDFALFMAYFPRLLAGPLCRSHQLLPQIMAPAPRSIKAPSEAVTLIASGLIKKLVLASYISTPNAAVFENPAHFSAVEAWIAMFAYSAEIYLDFSGYTDMARGLSLLLGYRLPENFADPYAAPNIGEFWKRWHITFSRWLRDYVYFPLGGSRGSQWRTSINYLLTFTLCGIWHGTRAGFVIWGVLHGLMLAAYRFSVNYRKARGTFDRAPSAEKRALGIVGTVVFCVIVRIFFNSPDLDRALAYFGALVSSTERMGPLDPWLIIVTVLGYALNFVGAPLRFRFLRFHQRLLPPLRPLLWLVIGLVVLSLKPTDVAPYIYFGF